MGCGIRSEQNLGLFEGGNLGFQERRNSFYLGPETGSTSGSNSDAIQCFLCSSVRWKVASILGGAYSGA